MFRSHDPSFSAPQTETEQKIHTHTDRDATQYSKTLLIYYLWISADSPIELPRAKEQILGSWDMLRRCQ